MMENLIHGDLILNIQENGSQIVLNWLGDSRAMDPASILDPYLKRVVESINGKNLIVDFRKLNSMNSSTVLPILTFIKNLEAASVNTEIIYDDACSWQRASFIPLTAITKFFKFIKVNKAAT